MLTTHTSPKFTAGARVSELTVPANIEAEQAVLGSILIDPQAILAVTPILKSDAFYLEKHAWIYEACGALAARNEPTDFQLVVAELERREQLNAVGGAAYLTALVNAVPTAVHVEHYAHLVDRDARLRRLILVAGEIAGLGYANNTDEIATIEARAQEILLAALPDRSSDFLSAEQAMAELSVEIWQRIADPREIAGLPTGFVELDRRIKGLRAGLYVIAGRPSMGKTAFGISLLERMCAKRTRVGFLSLEMTRPELMLRLAAIRSRLPTDALETGLVDGRRFTPAQEQQFRTAELAVAKLPFWIGNAGDFGSAEARAVIAQWVLREGVQAVIIDYLQLFDDRGENRNLAIDAATRSLIGAAKQHGIPVLCLSQLSRGVEHRDSHIPMLADLRDSGGIEQNADCVLFIHREDQFHVLDAKYTRDGKADIIIAKNRLGPGAGSSALLSFNDVLGCFEPWDEHD